MFSKNIDVSVDDWWFKRAMREGGGGGGERREKEREGRNLIGPEYGGFEVHLRFLKVADALVHW